MFETGARVGAYTLEARMGPAGAVEAWSAHDEEGTPVLLRIGRVRGGSADAVRTDLERDLALARQAQHPNVVGVLGVGVEGDRYFIATEPSDGLLLREVLDRARAHGPWPSPELSGYVVREIARGLACIHAVPTPSGDPLQANRLSPEGVVIDKNGRVRLLELVSTHERQALVETAGAKQTGQVAYSSPESVAQLSHDARSDLFTLGTLLWELLTGRPPFLRDSDLDTLAAIQTAQLPSLPPGVPAEIAQVALRCLQRKPEDRFTNAQEVVVALDVLLEDHPDADSTNLATLVTELSRPPETKKRKTAVFEAKAQGAHVGGANSGLDSAARALFGGALGVEEGPTDAETPVDPAKNPFFDPHRDGVNFDHPRFEVLGQLGSGAMGEVYKVRDRELDEVVALKRIPTNAGDNNRNLERLRREVRLARRIASRHVCRIFDIVDLGPNSRGLTMEVIEGATLAELMQGQLQTNYRRFASWGADIADGIAGAHAIDIIHRDLKPENIMIRQADDSAVLLDFGIARPQGDQPADPKLTQAGIIMGTPLYMSPEQLTNSPLDSRSDLYSLGLILAELVTGEVPLQGRSYSDILERRALHRGDPYRLGMVDPGAPEGLALVVDRLLIQAPVDRVASAAQIRDALRAVAEGRAPVLPAPTAPAPPAAPPAAAGPAVDPWRWGAPAALLAIIALVLGFWVYQRGTEPEGVDPGRHAAARLEDDAGTATAQTPAPDAGVETQAPDASQVATMPDAGKPDTGRKRRIRPAVPPPAEEM